LANILAVGIATLDIVNTVADYPNQDDEIRAINQNHSRGGNATNTLAILSQLRHSCYWAGTLVHETDTQLILNDLDEFKIDYSYVDFLTQGKIPTSYITLNQKNASRTIIHYRDLPEYSFQSFQKIPLDKFDWIHFEGRNTEEMSKMLRYCRNTAPHLKVSLEIEKIRDNIEILFEFADLLMFSKSYARSAGFNSAIDFLEKLPSNLQSKYITCTWGKDGASLLYDGKICSSPAYPITGIVNTLAAGDTFNAAIIDSTLRELPPQQCLNNACRLAAQKCTFETLKFIDKITLLSM